jgi:hypothetical protein
MWEIVSGTTVTDSSKLQWAPSASAHDPNPPITLESKPFAQCDWPVPRGKSPLFVTMETRPSEDGTPPFNQTAWPLPAPARGTALTWTVNLQESTLATAVTAAPFVPVEWAVPKRAAALRAMDPPNLLPTTLNGKDALPFRQTEWPQVRRVASLRPHDPQNLLETTLAVPFTQTAWPLPATKREPERGFVRGSRELLIGQDQFFGLAGSPSFDWPNPRGPQYPVGLRSHLVGNLLETTLASQDQLPFRQTEWPVAPAPKRAPLADPLNLLGTTLAVPFSQTNWPLPLRRVAGDVSFTQTSALSLQSVAAAPFTQSDWPLPSARQTGAISLRTWTEGRKAYYVDLSPFGPTEWPLARGTALAIASRGWSQNLLETTLSTPVVAAPFSQTEWPLPAPRPSWQALRASAIGRFPGQIEPLPTGRLQDWPNPVGTPGIRDLRTWTQDLATSTLFTPSPFAQADWPLPRTREGLRTLQTWTQDALRLPSPFAQMDWPLARGPVYPVTLRTLTQWRTLGLVDTFPFSLRDWPNPQAVPALRELRTFRHTLSLPANALFIPTAVADFIAFLARSADGAVVLETPSDGIVTLAQACAASVTRESRADADLTLERVVDFTVERP